VDDDAERWHHGWPSMMSYRIAISTSAVFNKTLNHLLLCQEQWFVIMDPMRKLVLICKVLWTVLRGSFNAYV
jgi:hypothetical protein